MSKMPTGWDTTAHNSWLAGQRQVAIQQLLARLNGSTAKRLPCSCSLPITSFCATTRLPRRRCWRWPTRPNPTIAGNLCSCLSRAGQYELAVTRLQTLLQRVPDDFHALDALCASLAKLDRYDEAAQAGTRSLTLKARSAGKVPPSWSLPAAEPTVWLADGSRKPDVIAFSLWGSGPRYLRGPSTTCWRRPISTRVGGCVLMESVAELLACLREHGAEVIMQSAGQPLRQRLCWRFQVANDPLVGRFLVRDVDSVPGVRERLAVQEWLASTRWFHIMRDWWSHTDLVLAGWGGVVPVYCRRWRPCSKAISPTMETPNIDQWFCATGSGVISRRAVNAVRSLLHAARRHALAAARPGGANMWGRISLRHKGAAGPSAGALDCPFAVFMLRTMMEQKKRIWVAVGVIENERGDIFIAKRSADRHQGIAGSFPAARWKPGRICLPRWIANCGKRSGSGCRIAPPSWNCITTTRTSRCCWISGR